MNDPVLLSLVWGVALLAATSCVLTTWMLVRAFRDLP